MVERPDRVLPPWPTAGRAVDAAQAAQAGELLEQLGFATLWATGADTALDGVFRIELARRCSPAGERTRYSEHTWSCDPFRRRASAGNEGARTSATQRMARDFGVSGAALAGALPARSAFAACERERGAGLLIVLERGEWSAWAERLGSGPRSEPALLGLVELAALVLPGRLPASGAALVDELVGGAREHPRAIGASALRAALAELLRRFHAQGELARELAFLGWNQARAGLALADPAAARELGLALALIEQPHYVDAQLAAAARSSPSTRTAAELGDWIAAARPPWAERGLGPREPALVPAQREACTPLDERDCELVDRAFEHALPELFGERGQYRASQHEVARAVARQLGSGELLLVHAPTGTGKTLAYLVPALLWALRREVRVAVATYTRMLQDQVMQREVGLALRALELVGAGGRPRVSVLKGRTNYLCWRALCAQAPEPMDGAAHWLAWTGLALFALGEAEGDLDRLDLHSAPVGAPQPDYGAEVERLLRAVRAQSGCCTHKDDRATCAAEAARRAAERAHLVITNQSFALARPEFFRHVVFDECEHLHEQARTAFSHEASTREAREALGRLQRPGAGIERSPLERLARAAPLGGELRRAAEHALAQHARALTALGELEQQLQEYESWREQRARDRDERDAHALFAEHLRRTEARGLLDARLALSTALDALCAALALVSACLDEAPLRGSARQRRALELGAAKLGEWREGLAAWLPLDEDGCAARIAAETTFHDVERAPRGGFALIARALLPHEQLGRHYYPDLENGIFLSATTRLAGGFEAASRYLGLARAAAPAPEEERAARALRTFGAPEVFDYERVLVLAPRDAPPAQAAQAHLDYVGRFVGHLGERTRGRMLVLFTNAEHCAAVGRRLAPFFAERGIPCWFQGMPGAGKEELAQRFRDQADSVLLGLDTFWYGADFPGETLEYLVIARLPYGVPDRYHQAQCAAIGPGEQRRSIYMPRALAKFRQGFGRLMRRASDRGCVFLLDKRVHDPKHRVFLRELPLAREAQDPPERGAHFLRASSDECLRAALVHMNMLADVRRRNLDQGFAQGELGFGEAAREETESHES
jgi:ATP-dependent DNA helicase DinG